MIRTNNAVCIFCAGNDGGTGTLAIRIAEWCNKHEIRFCYCKFADSNPLNTIALKEKGARLEMRDDKTFLEQFEAVYEPGCEYTAIVYTLEVYHRVEKIQSRYPAIKRILLYVVLRDGLCYNLRNNTRWGNLFSKLATRIVNRRYIKKLIKCDCLLFMDEQCIDQTKKMAGIALPDTSKIMLRLPYSISRYNGRLKNHISRGEAFTIMTAARLDFPFKAYVMGLINTFARLKKSHPELRLVIVGDGKDSRTVREAVLSQESYIRNDIELTGTLSYSDLKKLFKRTDLFIGMGTSLLDAADSLTPAMLAAAFTYELETIGLFSEHPEKLGIDQGSDDAYAYIESVINMSISQYHKVVSEQYEKLKSIYDIDAFMKRVLTCTRLNYRLTDEPFHCAVYELFVKMLETRRRINKTRRRKAEK